MFCIVSYHGNRESFRGNELLGLKALSLTELRYITKFQIGLKKFRRLCQFQFDSPFILDEWGRQRKLSKITTLNHGSTIWHRSRPGMARTYGKFCKGSANENLKWTLWKGDAGISLLRKLHDEMEISIISGKFPLYGYMYNNKELPPYLPSPRTNDIDRLCLFVCLFFLLFRYIFWIMPFYVLVCHFLRNYHICVSFHLSTS